LKFTDATKEYNIDNYLKADDNDKDATQFGFVSEKATVDEAFASMRNATCVDVFVTMNGQRTEPVLGWLPDDKLSPT
jgi:hypothetical protein